MTKKKNNDLKNILKKKVSELSKEEIISLEKPLGTYDLPFPMFGSISVEEDGRIEREQALTYIAGDINDENNLPMVVYSERSLEEVIGLSYRDMPVPSMLPFFYDSLERRRIYLDDETGEVDMEKSKGRLQFVVGDPGAGKSFMGAMMGRMRTTDPIEVLDCGGKNMRELLFETVLDFGAGDALPSAIDARIAAGTLEEMSFGLLKNMKHVEEVDGKLSIDWTAISKGDAKEVEAVYNVLTKVSKIEGLDNAGGNALGMNSQFGPLITSFIKGDELVLDEYNKSKEGTDDNLQTFLQFATGEIDECTVENPLKNKDSAAGPSHFTFRREDTKAGWFLTLTGNATEDGITTRSLNKSVYSRLDPQSLAKPTELDWQHRWCQMAMGIPLTTLYYTFKEQADENPEAFTDALKYWRTAGLTDEQVKNIPDHQMEMIENWQGLVQTAQKVAKLYAGWQALTDADAIFDNGNDDLVDEVDPEFSKKHCIDFRKVIKHLEEALPIRAKMKPTESGIKFAAMKNWSKMPERSSRQKEGSMLNFGSRYTELLERKMYEMSGAMEKPALYKKLQQLAKDSGLKDLYLQEGAHSSQKSVESLLNIRALNTQNPAKQAEMVQTMLCDHLREMFKDLTDDNEQIVTTTELQALLKERKLEDTSETNRLQIPNKDVETLAEKPFAEAELFDTLSWPNGKDLPFWEDEIVDHNDLMATFAMPVVGVKNIEALWNENLADYLKKSPADTAPAVANDDEAPVANGGQSMDDVDTETVDESVSIAEGTSTTGIKTTTVLVTSLTGEKDDDGDILKEVSVHIVQNENNGKTLIVGEELSPRLKSMFSQAGLVHVNRNDADAETKIKAGLNEVLKGVPAEVMKNLNGAFSYRTDLDTADQPLFKRMAQNHVAPQEEAQDKEGLRKYVVYKNKAA